VKVARFEWGDAAELAAELRGLQPPRGRLADEVAELIDAVVGGGDAAVLELEDRFGTAPKQLEVVEEELRSAPGAIHPSLAEALETAAANIRAVAEAELSEGTRVELEAGHSVELRDVPVAAAGAYAPGGGAAYPSTALMCCVPAGVAGVDRVAVSSPCGPDGAVNPFVLAACAIAGADQVYAMGGVQAVAALALGTESVDPVDVVVGPGNRYVQEAKRQLFGQVGIEGIAGPSELMVIADASADVDWVALDLCAQAEHGSEGLLVAAAPAELLVAIEATVLALAEERETVADVPLALVSVSGNEQALELANALAPEHLELACDDAEQLAVEVRTAGCVFVGGAAGAAFGDYVAGSNHVLPTGGAARFQSALSPATFRRRMARVSLPGEAPARLAPAGAALARAEGFPVHAESMERRA
jgi:histidinol dehydrogenase